MQILWCYLPFLSFFFTTIILVLGCSFFRQTEYCILLIFFKNFFFFFFDFLEDRVFYVFQKLIFLLPFRQSEYFLKKGRNEVKNATIILKLFDIFGLNIEHKWLWTSYDIVNSEFSFWHFPYVEQRNQWIRMTVWQCLGWSWSFGWQCLGYSWSSRWRCDNV